MRGRHLPTLGSGTSGYISESLPYHKVLLIVLVLEGDGSLCNILGFISDLLFRLRMLNLFVLRIGLFRLLLWRCCLCYLLLLLGCVIAVVAGVGLLVFPMFWHLTTQAKIYKFIGDSDTRLITKQCTFQNLQ